MNIKDFWKGILGGNKPYGIKISADGGTVTFQPGELNRFFEDYEKAKAENSRLHGVSGKFPLNENAKKKLEYIKGSCIVRDFPHEQPNREWAGAVLDLLEEMGLGN